MIIEKYFCRNRIESFMKCKALTCKDIKTPLIAKQQTTCHKFWIINLENAFLLAEKSANQTKILKVYLDMQN